MAAGPKLPPELRSMIEERGGASHLPDGWMEAYKYAVGKGNQHKGSMLYADAHYEDYQDVTTPDADDDDDDDGN